MDVTFDHEWAEVMDVVTVTVNTEPLPSAH